MKKSMYLVILIVLIFIAILFTFYFLVIKPIQLNIKQNPNIFHCNTKEDCVLMNFNCNNCGCNISAINKKYKDKMCNGFQGDVCEEICDESYINYDCYKGYCVALYPI
jgi:hypothetical protein